MRPLSAPPRRGGGSQSWRSEEIGSRQTMHDGNQRAAAPVQVALFLAPLGIRVCRRHAADISTQLRGAPPHSIRRRRSMVQRVERASGEAHMRVDVEFRTEDGVMLRGWHYRPDRGRGAMADHRHGARLLGGEGDVPRSLRRSVRGGRPRGRGVRQPQLRRERRRAAPGNRPLAADSRTIATRSATR
jgi:hypothetical protein